MTRASVADAIASLRYFDENLDRNGAAVLLSMWRRRDELSPRDRLAVLDAFGPAPAQPGRRARVTRSAGAS